MLVVALIAGPQLLRRPAMPPAPTQELAGTDGRHTAPASAPAPAPPFDTPAVVASPPPASTDGERQPNLRRAAIAACEGRAIGAACSFVTPRNEVINARCMTSTEGLPICRPPRSAPQSRR